MSRGGPLSEVSGFFICDRVVVHLVELRVDLLSEEMKKFSCQERE